MDAALEREVRNRAGGRCEYCRLPQSCHRKTFHVDHVIAEQHGGPTAADNLAVACSHCNLHKGPNVAGVDPETGGVVRLYHPRRDRWDEHFQWQGAMIRGTSEIGRVTVIVLGMNSSLRVRLREALIADGQPPPGARAETETGR